MFIAYSSIEYSDERDEIISKEIGEFQNLYYNHDLKCACVMLHDMTDIHLKISYDTYLQMRELFMKAISNNVPLVEINQGVCLGLDDEDDEDDVQYLCEQASELQPLNTFDYKIEF